jgi:hypothetical protein
LTLIILKRFGHKNEKNSEIFVELSKNQDSQLIKVIHKVTLPFTPYPLFQWYPQSKEILLNLNMKWGSRVIIIIVQVGVVKTYVAAVEALRKKERGDETQFTINIGV